MKLTRFGKTVATVALLAAGSAAFAQNGRDIVQRALDVKSPDFTHALLTMDLIAKDGTVEESRTVEEYGREKDDLASVVMLFRSPASVKDTRFLQIENKGRDDDKWIYLPALRNTRRIAASQGSQSFVGTDATYDDMSTREIDDDTHEFIRSETKNGFDCNVVRSTPVDLSSSQYSYRIQWIDKATDVPIYAEMYDKRGELIKVLTIEKLQNVTSSTGKSYNIPMTTLLQNVQTGHSTRMAITRLELDKPIPDRVFTSNFLITGR